MGQTKNRSSNKSHKMTNIFAWKLRLTAINNKFLADTFVVQANPI